MSKSWIKEGLISLIVGIALLILDFIEILSTDLFGFNFGAFVILYYVGYWIFLLFFGMLFGFLIEKAKNKLKDSRSLIFVYIIFSITFVISFFWIYKFSFYNPYAFMIKFVYIIPFCHKQVINFYIYKVIESQIVDPAQVEYIRRKSNKEFLTLQTCWPPGTTLKRLLVFAARVEE